MNVLERIMAVKRAEIAAAKNSIPMEQLEARARAASPPREFVAAIRKKLAEDFF